MVEVLASTLAMFALRVLLFLEVESPPELSRGHNNMILRQESYHKAGYAEARLRYTYQSTIRMYRNSFVQRIILREIRASLWTAMLLSLLVMSGLSQ